MDFAISDNLLKDDLDALVVGIYKDNALTQGAQALDEATGGQIKDTLSLGDFKAAAGDSLRIFLPKNIAAKRIILIGLGDPDKMNVSQYQKALTGLAKTLKHTDSERIGCFLPEITVNGKSTYWKTRFAVETVSHGLYTFNDFKGKKDEAEKAPKQQTLYFEADAFHKEQTERGIEHGKMIAESVKLTRDLGNTPANVCNPTYMAEKAKEFTKGLHKTHLHIISETEMADLGMGCYLAVSQGSDEPAKMIVLEYNGGDKLDKPVVLVGKGVTFDTGGLSLKPGPNMMGMKYDMCGAASVLGAFKMAAELKLPINLIGIMACVENMPGSHATRPDDVVTTLSGKTVEIANTDAEGRLVLCDALTYAQRYNPSALIDIATLTGACVMALGRHPSGMLANNDELAQEILKAGTSSHDRAWQLPLWDDYQNQLDSPVADMINIGGPEAGTVTAACFLSRFTEEVPWAHLDVAGTAFQTGKDAAASGRPVPLLCEFLLNRANAIPA